MSSQSTQLATTQAAKLPANLAVAEQQQYLTFSLGEEMFAIDEVAVVAATNKTES